MKQTKIDTIYQIYTPHMRVLFGVIQARSKLEAIAKALGVDLSQAARLAGKVPAAWNR